MVRLYREHFGKGPTKAKTYALDDLVICVMRDGLSPVEKTLYEAGRASTVREMRSAYLDAVAETFNSVVEELTGRKVRAFMSQTNVDPDLMIAVFFLDSPLPWPPISIARRTSAASRGMSPRFGPICPVVPGGVEGVARAAAFDEEHPPVLLRRREWLLHLGLEGSPFAGGDADRPFLDLDQAPLDRVADQLRAGAEAELLLDVGTVGFHRADAEVELLGDLVVGVAEGDQA
jgi:uncharacterized protein YbcI